MSAFSFKTIIVKGDGIRKEGMLAAASNDITPGQFVRRLGHNFSEVSHALAQSLFKAVAVEQETFGTGVTEDYDTEGERVLYHVVPPGTEVFAILNAGETASVGDRLRVAVGGNLEVNATNAICVAMEDVDASAESTRILVEIL
jgi:hypothetical protein